MHDHSDITGKRYGFLVVLRRTELRSDRGILWECQCKCGKIILRSRNYLKSVKSCGCMVGITHGLTKLHWTEHQVWYGMITRCTNQNASNYPIYGGRGISVCERWLKSFKAFFDDMGLRPSDNHSLERINNDGHYEPGNVRWATNLEQQHNKRTNRFLTHNGETKCIAEWARTFGLEIGTVRRRMKYGVVPPELFQQPLSWRKRKQPSC